MTTEASRKAFEAWKAAAIEDGMVAYWDCWQASRKQALAEVSEPVAVVVQPEKFSTEIEIQFLADIPVGELLYRRPADMLEADAQQVAVPQESKAPQYFTEVDFAGLEVRVFMRQPDALPILVCSDSFAAPQAPAQPPRCEYCDDTGDVHDQTGEWRGVCTCKAGRAVLAAQEAKQ